MTALAEGPGMNRAQVGAKRLGKRASGGQPSQVSGEAFAVGEAEGD